MWIEIADERRRLKTIVSEFNEQEKLYEEQRRRHVAEQQRAKKEERKAAVEAQQQELYVSSLICLCFSLSASVSLSLSFYFFVEGCHARPFMCLAHEWAAWFSLHHPAYLVTSRLSRSRSGLRAWRAE